MKAWLREALSDSRAYIAFQKSVEIDWIRYRCLQDAELKLGEGYSTWGVAWHATPAVGKTGQEERRW